MKLNEKELIILQTFLTSPFANARPMTLTQAHGFLCAVLSAPHMIPISLGHDVLFGGEPEFTSEEEASHIIGLLIRLNNQVSSEIRGETPLQLILWENDKIVSLEDSSEETIAQWCDGYLTGAKMDSCWNSDQNGLALLLPFGVLANKFAVKGKKDRDGNIIDDDSEYRALYKNSLIDHIKKIKKYWLHAHNHSAHTVKHEEPVRNTNKVGRNDACPCGSGKKYKKCCITTAASD